MASDFDQVWCDECGVEITWASVMIDGRPYCCHDCAVGLECACSDANTPWEDEPSPFWMAGIGGNLESMYGLEYGLE